MRRGPSATLTLVVALGLAAASAHPALASVSTKQVSVTRRGGDPRGGSFSPSITADGRYVAFASRAQDLVPGDGGGIQDGDGIQDGYQDVFVRDTVAGTTVRASVDTGGGDPNNGSWSSSISADGRYVAFWSTASDLVAGDVNDSPDVFVRDVLMGTTVRASVDTGGGNPNDGSYGPSISADGRYAAFYSYASDLVAGDGNRLPDVFVRDLVAGTTVRASVDRGGGSAHGLSAYPSISPDGRYVAFYSDASHLVDDECGGGIFVRDLLAGITVRADVDARGGCANDQSTKPSISADARYVAFESYASDLVTGDGNGYKDVFVRDLVAGTTVRASVDTGGGDPNFDSIHASISADGRYVAFYSYASDLVTGDGNGVGDIFVRDLVAGTTVRASLDTDGGDPNGSSSGPPSISADGQYVAFSSFASDLVEGPGDRGGDVFIARWS